MGAYAKFEQFLFLFSFVVGFLSAQYSNFRWLTSMVCRFVVVCTFFTLFFLTLLIHLCHFFSFHLTRNWRQQRRKKICVFIIVYEHKSHWFVSYNIKIVYNNICVNNLILLLFRRVSQVS